MELVGDTDDVTEVEAEGSNKWRHKIKQWDLLSSIVVGVLYAAVGCGSEKNNTVNHLSCQSC